MRNVIVKTGTVEDFFARGREIAKKIDNREPLKPEFTLTFEDPGDMFAVMSPVRLDIIRAAKTGPSSIAEIAQCLKRDRKTVKRDVDVLVMSGLLKIDEVTRPGHGKQKIVRAAADKIQLQAVVTGIRITIL